MRICSIVLDIRVGVCSSYPRFPGSESFERGPEVAAKLRRRKAFGPTGFASYREPGDRWKGERDQGETRGEDTGLRQGRLGSRLCARPCRPRGPVCRLARARGQRSRTRHAVPAALSRKPEWSPTGFENLLAQGIAVSDKNDHIYVADSGRGVVFDFSSTTDKVADRWEGGATPAGSFGGSRVSVAVDNGTGDVYVADRTHGVIDKFDEGGNLITSFGDSEPAHERSARRARDPGWFLRSADRLLQQLRDRDQPGDPRPLRRRCGPQGDRHLR